MDDPETWRPPNSTTPKLNDPKTQRPQNSMTPKLDNPEAQQPWNSTTPKLNNPKTWQPQNSKTPKIDNPNTSQKQGPGEDEWLLNLLVLTNRSSFWCCHMMYAYEAYYGNKVEVIHGDLRFQTSRPMIKIQSLQGKNGIDATAVLSYWSLVLAGQQYTRG